MPDKVVKPPATPGDLLDLPRTSAAGGFLRPSVYTCGYLYRTNGWGIGEGGTQNLTPEYFYCHFGGGAFRSNTTGILKRLAKDLKR